MFMYRQLLLSCSYDFFPKDVRDMAHIPVLLHSALPLLNRVDIWSAPFTPPSPIVPLVPSQNNDGSFAHKAMEDVWGTLSHSRSFRASQQFLLSS